jgi:hypothetical protein
VPLRLGDSQYRCTASRSRPRDRVWLCSFDGHNFGLDRCSRRYAVRRAVRGYGGFGYSLVRLGTGGDRRIPKLTAICSLASMGDSCIEPQADPSEGKRILRGDWHVVLAQRRGPEQAASIPKLQRPHWPLVLGQLVLHPKLLLLVQKESHDTRSTGRHQTTCLGHSQGPPRPTQVKK